MRIAVAGRSFIADALIERLVSDGHDVVVVGSHLGMSERTARQVSDHRATFVRIDAEHGSGEARRALRGEARLVLLDHDVAVNRALLRATRGIVSHIVYASSTSVYGSPERVPIAETDRTSPLDPHARALLAGEHAVRRAARTYGITATILRCAAVYGPGDTPFGLVHSFVRAGIAGTPPEIEGDGFDEDDYVYIDDVVEATMHALERAADSTYNVGTGVGTSRLTLARAVLELMGVDAEPIVGTRRQPERARIVCSTAHAAQGLGFIAWPNLHHGIQNEIAWLRSALVPAAAGPNAA